MCCIRPFALGFHLIWRLSALFSSVCIANVYGLVLIFLQFPYSEGSDADEQGTKDTAAHAAAVQAEAAAKLVKQKG